MFYHCNHPIVRPFWHFEHPELPSNVELQVTRFLIGSLWEWGFLRVAKGSRHLTGWNFWIDIPSFIPHAISLVKILVTKGYHPRSFRVVVYVYLRDVRFCSSGNCDKSYLTVGLLFEIQIYLHSIWINDIYPFILNSRPEAAHNYKRRWA